MEPSSPLAGCRSEQTWTVWPNSPLPVTQEVGLATTLVQIKTEKWRNCFWSEFVVTWNAPDVSFSYTGLLLGKDRNPKKDVDTLWWNATTPKTVPLLEISRNRNFNHKYPGKVCLLLNVSDSGGQRIRQFSINLSESHADFIRCVFGTLLQPYLTSSRVNKRSLLFVIFYCLGGNRTKLYIGL